MFFIHGDVTVIDFDSIECGYHVFCGPDVAHRALSVQIEVVLTRFPSLGPFSRLLRGFHQVRLCLLVLTKRSFPGSLFLSIKKEPISERINRSTQGMGIRDLI